MKRDFFDLLCSPAFWAVLAVAASMPLWVPPYYLGIATQTLVFVGLALAWNIVGGLAGQISLAHSLFVAIGGLLPSGLLISFGVNMWAGMALAALSSAALGVFIAWVDFRFRLPHLSFALVTLAFAEVGELVVLGTDFLGGASGLICRVTRATSAFSNSGDRRGISGSYFLSPPYAPWPTSPSSTPVWDTTCAPSEGTRTRLRRLASAYSKTRRWPWP